MEKLEEVFDDLIFKTKIPVNIKLNESQLVDLMDVIKKGVYYPVFMGSFSIKKVAPAILGETASYANLEIGDGFEAMLAFEKIKDLPNDSEDRQALTDSLRKYCEQDTLLMVRLHHWLRAKAVVV